MNKQKRYMALDFGTSNGVAMAGAFDGKKLELETMRRFEVAATSMLGTTYWDFPSMLINAKRGLSAFVASHGSDLAGVACDSWGVDFGLLDKTGHLLANPVHHLDMRTEGAMAKFHAMIPGRSLYQLTGVVPRRQVTLYQLYSMVQANNQLLDKAVTMLLMADLVSYFLSGTPVQEYTLATTTSMYDVDSLDWSRDTILTAKIPPVIVPEIVAPGTVIGPMLDSVAAECGLGQVPIIAPASHAMAGALAATPAEGDDWLYLVSGDWNQVGVEAATPLINDATFAAGFTTEGGVDGSFRLFKGLNGLSILEACLGVWTNEDRKEPDVGAIIELAEAAEPMARLINPDDLRLEGVADMPRALNQLLAESGQPAAETRSDLVRLCLDSLVMSHRHAVLQLMELTARKYSVIHVVGWGAGVPVLNQALADATGIPVKAGPMEAKSIGNIIMQAMALGDVASLEEAREVVRNSFETTFHEPGQDTAKWDDAYGRYLKMIR